MLSLEQKIFDFFKITILFYYSENIYRLPFLFYHVTNLYTEDKIFDYLHYLLNIIYFFAIKKHA